MQVEAPDLPSQLDERLAAMTAELEGFTRRATRLTAMSAALAGAMSVEEVVDVVTAHAPELFGATSTLVYLVEDGQLRLAGFGGVSAERVAPYREVAPASTLPIADVWREGRPLWLEDRASLLRAYPELAGVHREGAPLQAMMSLPLLDGGAVIGGLGFSFYAAQRFSPVEREFYRTLASQCAQAIVRARLSAAERRARAAQQRQQQLLETLLQASAALAETLDSRKALEALARLVVPAVADWCAIDELAPDGQIRRLAVQHADPDKVAYAHELMRRWPPDPSAPRGIPKVLRTGQTEWAEALPAAMIESIPDPERREVVRALGLTAYAIVPMIARGRVLGALSLIQAESRRGFDAAELRFAEDLARRSALALDNARLYESAEGARDLLHGLLMRAPAAICLTRGREHVFELANAPYRALIGRQDLLGRSMREVLPELAGQGPLETHDRVYATGETFTAHEMPIRRRWPERPDVEEVRHFNVVYQPERGAGGQVTGLAIFAFDVTAQVVARRGLEALAAEVGRSEARMLSLIHI